METRIPRVALAALLLLGAGVARAAAQDPRLEALGGASLVVESETTILSLYNLGNPAGAAWLPRQNRLDLSAGVDERAQRTDFTTLYSQAKYSTDLFPIPIDPYGNTDYIDAFGNSLTPFRFYSLHSATLHASFNDWGNTGYGGYLTWLDPNFVLQVLPQADGSRLSSTDQASDNSNFSGGGTVRGAWQAQPDLVFGTDVILRSGRSNGWGQPYWTTDLNGDTINPRGFFSDEEQHVGAKVGAAWSTAAVFDPQDHLDLGLTLGTQRWLSTSDTELFSGELGTGTVLGRQHLLYDERPSEALLQGVYHYLSVMDIGLVTGYQNDRVVQAWDTQGQASVAPYLASARDNFDYELSWRLRLPMVRDDDLRFGIVFNNRGVDQIYPDGQLRQYLPNGLYAAPVTISASSSIGIATAFVPEAGSLVTLEYFLGSSKSRQEGNLVASSGFNRFNLGAQIEIMEGLTVRAGYSDLRVAYESQENQIQFTTGGIAEYDSSGNIVTALTSVERSIETSSFRFGVGVGGKPCHVDLTLTASSSATSPFGWTLQDKPIGLDNVNLDSDLHYSALLGISCLF